MGAGQRNSHWKGVFGVVGVGNKIAAGPRREVHQSISRYGRAVHHHLIPCGLQGNPMCLSARKTGRREGLLAELGTDVNRTDGNVEPGSPARLTLVFGYISAARSLCHVGER